MLLAQGIPLSSLSGRVSADGGGALAAVVVTAESPELQGRREARTTAAGEYVLPFLPPGAYTIRFSLAGMQSIEKTITLNAAVGGRLDVAMKPAPVEESVTVSADALAGTPLETTQVASTYKQSLVNELPLDRSLRSTVLLAPGVDDSGPSGNIGSANPAAPAIVISGAQSFESLFMVDGAVVNENVRGQPQSLYIEDAIQETTVLTGSISAEYGRFTGGVVNVITRSGGNQFHGSFRTNFTSDGWRALDPIEQGFDEDPRLDQVDESYEATLGGAIWKDRIWFFAAGRRQSISNSQEIFAPEDTSLGDQASLFIPYTHSFEESRAEGKLTGNLTPSHNLVAAYTAVRSKEENFQYLPAGDLEALDTTEAPYSILTANYNGILSDRLFVEAQFSKRWFEIQGGGSPYSEFVAGTRVDTDRGTVNSPAGYEGYPENYGNTGWLAKASYLVSSESLGTHDLRLGYEWFVKTLRANYAFSGSGYVLSAGSVIRDNQIFPVVMSGGDFPSTLEWRPILEASQGDRFLTQSIFFNDHAQLGGRLTLNLGVRYDASDAANGAGRSVSVTGTWSPRVAAQFDASGKGTLLIDAGYARYVAGLHEGIVQLFSEAGQTSIVDWTYTGPCINCDPNAPTNQLMNTAQALAIVQQWFETVGRSTKPSYVRIQGVNRIVPTDGLVSPTASEYSFGVGVALGSKGWARADYLYRNYQNFYDDRIDLTTGQADSVYGPLDVQTLENSPVLRRRYEAVQTRIDYRFSPQVFAGVSYTWSRLTGNVIGENDVVSAAPDHVGEYPEYQRASWAYPTGYLPGDQRNRVRTWFGATVPVSFGEIGGSLLESYASGLPYEATADVPVAPYVNNPGYLMPPDTKPYFFSGRGAYRMPSISSTDVAVTVTTRLFESVDLFVQPQVLNVFNQHGVLAVDASVTTADPSDPSNHPQPFNPFTQKPLRGVNYELAPTFGTPIQYQPPRTFRFSVGLRF
jgi:hypothetical protein